MHSPFILVIFGATGDLTYSKLIPALFLLYKHKQLPKDFYVIGFARRILSSSDFRNLFIPENEDKQWESFSEHLRYQRGVFNDPEGYFGLIEQLELIDKKHGACITRLFYLATPPINYEDILGMLVETKLSEGCGQGSNNWTRLALEKPFGKDIETAKRLDKKLSEVFEEKQIFRVDHYLGKETVQNILAFRFANGIFEPIWNKDYIDHVQITWGEKKGIGNRGAFFDGVGLLRDVGQNHLMQLIAAVAMEQPSSFSKEGVRNARAEAIKAIRCIAPDKVDEYVVRGQYNGYKGEKDVVRDSLTETFVSMKLYVDTDRFSHIPFYIRAGKGIPEDIVEISVVFKQTCHILFKEYGCPEIGNVLTFRIQPNEGIRLRIIAKKPGAKLALDAVDLKFSYKDDFGEKGIEAYEKLLLDIFAGDQMLFNRSDELESSWEFITRILEGWQERKNIYSYQIGSWGPKEANNLIEKDGRKWV